LAPDRLRSVELPSGDAALRSHFLDHTENAAASGEQVSGGHGPRIGDLECAVHPGTLVVRHVHELRLDDIDGARDGSACIASSI